VADRRVGIFPHGQGRVVWTAVAAGDLAQLTSFRPRCQLRRDRASPQRDGSGRSASSPAPARADPKTVVLHTPAGYRFAVLAASDRLDLHKAADALGVRRHDVRLATEADMAADFSQYEVGAIPPIGPDTPQELVDLRLLDYAHVLCPAGDHRHSLLVDPMDIVRVTGARSVDVREN